MSAHPTQRVKRVHVSMPATAGRQRMWQAMRVLRSFTVADLQATAEVSRQAAVFYVGALRDEGYLQAAATGGRRHAGSGLPAATYRLVRNTGPLGLRVSRDKTVFNPNLQPACTVPMVSLPRPEYERALRCIAVVEKLRAFAPTAELERVAATALAVAR